jgi:hypothetical protein
MLNIIRMAATIGVALGVSVPLASQSWAGTPAPQPDTANVDATGGWVKGDLVQNTKRAETHREINIKRTPKSGTGEGDSAPTTAVVRCTNRLAPGFNGQYGWCPTSVTDAKTAARHASKPVSEKQLRQVVTKLKLPNPTPRFGPDPSVNEWKMLAVGFPVWLWTDSPKTVTSTATNDGLTFTLKATWTSTTFNLGDGHTKTCTNTSVYPAHIDKPGSPSPTCGHIYDTASPKGHPYTVTAETHWRIDWTTGGQTGSFNHTYTGNRTLEIGELASMIKR